MNGEDTLIKFWQALVAIESLPMPLRSCGAVVLLASPSSCDAEWAISTLNRIVTALRNRMSWPMVRLHLIGAEDVDPDGYPYELVAQSWGAFSHSARTARAQRAHSARAAPIITVIIRVTAPKTTHLRNHAQPIQISKIQTSDACHGSQGPKFCPL